MKLHLCAMYKKVVFIKPVKRNWLESLVAAVRYQREAEKQRVMEDLEALDHKRQELKGLLAVYSNH